MAKVQPDVEQPAEEAAVPDAAVSADANPNATTDSAEEQPGKKLTPAPLSKMFINASFLDYCLLFVGTLGAIGNGSVNPFMIYVWGKMIDAVGPHGPDMGQQLILMAYVAVIALVTATVQGVCLRSFSQRLSDRVRNLYFEKILFKDVTWYDLGTPASLATQMNEDADKIAAAFGDKFGMGLSGFGGFLICMVLGFYMGWKLALVVFAFVPVMAVGMVLTGTAMQEIAEETQSWYGKANALIEECFGAVRTVLAFGGEHRQIAKYAAAVRGAQAGAMRNNNKAAIGMGWLEGIYAMANAAALLFGVYLIYNDEVNSSTGRIWTGGDIIIVFFMLLTGGFLIGQIEPAVKVMSEGRMAIARYLEVAEAAAQIQCVANDTRQVLSHFESFEFQGVKFSYPARPETKVLKGVSFTITRGQKVAFVGESGSGKSTIMALLERFYDPTEGCVMLNGVDCKSFQPSSFRSLIGYVGQEPVLFATSVRNNILQSKPEATNDELKHVAGTAQLDFIEKLPQGFETFVGSGGSQFSGGQKQRIAIARALLNNPKVLFLDEATSALDSASEKMIQDTLESITKGDLTTVSIAHRLTTIKKSDVIYVLKDGVVEEQGSHEDLIGRKGLYNGLWAAQAKGEATSAGNANATTLQVSAADAGAEVQVTEDTPSEGRGNNAEDAMQEVKEEEAKEKEKLKSFSMVKSMKRLLQYNRPEWCYYVWGLMGSVLHGLLNPLQAFLLVGVLNAFYNPNKDAMWNDGLMLCVQFFCLGFITIVAASIEGASFGIVMEAMTSRLRIALLTHVFKQEVGFHDDPEHTPALIGTALSLWAYRVKNLNKTIAAGTAVSTSLIAGLAIAFYGSWRMTLVMFAAIPILAIAGTVQMVFMMGGTSMSNPNIRVAMQVVSDAVQNSRTVQACGLEKPLVKYHSELVALASKGYWYKAALSGFGFGVSLSAPAAVMILGFWYSQELISNGTASFTGVMYAFMGILYAAMGAGQFMAMLGDIDKAKVACVDMFKLMDRESQINGLEPDGETPSWSVSKAQAGNIEFEGVKFAYPFRADVPILKGVNFKLKAGQSVGLVGPSGGGKSTIMALLQRYYDPAEGGVYIGEARTPLSSVNIRWWRKHVGFVGQEPILFNTTVKENVMYGLDEGETVTDAWLEDCKTRSHLEFLDNMESHSGWDTQVGPRGSRLSGGQKQRVAICRALVRDPPVLLLDEATSALDNESERVVQQALEKARVGRTSIAIAHRLSTIQDCDVILVTAEGVIVEQGSHEELMRIEGGVYAKLQN